MRDHHQNQKGIKSGAMDQGKQPAGISRWEEWQNSSEKQQNGGDPC